MCFLTTTSTVAPIVVADEHPPSLESLVEQLAANLSRIYVNNARSFITIDHQGTGISS